MKNLITLLFCLTVLISFVSAQEITNEETEKLPLISPIKLSFLDKPLLAEFEWLTLKTIILTITAIILIVMLIRNVGLFIILAILFAIIYALIYYM